MRAILTFHSIDNAGSVLSFPQATFVKLLSALYDAGMPVYDLDTLLAPGIRRGVALTFDDGMRTVYTQALPVLRDFKTPAHLFLTTGAVGGTNRWATQPVHAPSFDMLSWGEIEQLHASDVRIESHTHSHPDLRALDAVRIGIECNAADRLIESRLGRRPRFFAYPYGYRNSQVCDAVRGLYQASVTTELNTLCGMEDRAALPRLDSYYLRAPWVFRRIDDIFPQAYLTLRSMLRKLRGSE